MSKPLSKYDKAFIWLFYGVVIPIAIYVHLMLLVWERTSTHY